MLLIGAIPLSRVLNPKPPLGRIGTTNNKQQRFGSVLTRLYGEGGGGGEGSGFCNNSWPSEFMAQRGDLYGALHPLP